MEEFKQFLESDSRYKYTSSKIQNEIISSCSNIILKNIVKVINTAECFSVLANETTDISGNKQLTLYIRYVAASEKDVHMCESFLKFIDIKSLIGKYIASSIINGKYCNILTIELIFKWP